ncbi:MAG: hypothetical protein AAB740_03070 [Patescibacteria group bacterium]
MTLTAIAKQLNIPFANIEKEVLESYLAKKLLENKIDLFSLANKYKIKSLSEFDRLIKAGKISETTQTRDDFFRIDYLTSQIALMKNIIQSF